MLTLSFPESGAQRHGDASRSFDASLAPSSWYPSNCVAAALHSWNPPFPSDADLLESETPLTTLSSCLVVGYKGTRMPTSDSCLVNGLYTGWLLHLGNSTSLPWHDDNVHGRHDDNIAFGLGSAGECVGQAPNFGGLWGTRRDKHEASGSGRLSLSRSHRARNPIARAHRANPPIRVHDYEADAPRQTCLVPLQSNVLEMPRWRVESVRNRCSRVGTNSETHPLGSSHFRSVSGSVAVLTFPSSKHALIMGVCSSTLTSCEFLDRILQRWHRAVIVRKIGALRAPQLLFGM